MLFTFPLWAVNERSFFWGRRFRMSEPRLAGRVYETAKKHVVNGPRGGVLLLTFLLLEKEKQVRGEGAEEPLNIQSVFE